MASQFKDYFEKTVGLTGVFLERAEAVVGFYETLFPDDIKDVFVCEYIESGGKRQYESLWIFTSDCVGEAKSFITEDNFDATPMNNIRYWKLKRTKFDGQTTSDDSRVALNLSFGSLMQGDLKASKENCTQLMQIFTKHVLPNLRKQ